MCFFQSYHVKINESPAFAKVSEKKDNKEAGNVPDKAIKKNIKSSTRIMKNNTSYATVKTTSVVKDFKYFDCYL